eukprot:TRINITY_DN3384_c0_g1_i1.p1 TRINITY_DN3384_c0_g1~~TRINITY_DN3384_c0_g1_i1.p1  ORF type:complete len:330 (+),score=76.43 TRINITY_DN3384_c0_g1_i1:175-1164(+)
MSSLALELSLVRNRLREETDRLIEQICLIGKENWEDVLRTLFAYKDSVQTMTTDSISHVPGDIMKLIFKELNLPDQINLSSTCRRFHGFSWLNELWKSQAIPVWEKNVPFPVKKLFIAIDKLPQLHWKKVAKSLTSDSFKIEYEMNDSRDIIPASVTIGDFKEGKSLLRIRRNDTIEYGDWVANGRGNGVLISSDREYVGTFKDKFFNGKGKILYKNGISHEGKFRFGWRYGKGTMKWPDGFSHTGEWKEDSPIDVVNSLHPSIRESLSTDQCTKHITKKNDILPQLLYGDMCLTCANKCQKCDSACDEEDFLETKWIRFGQCKCPCTL